MDSPQTVVGFSVCGNHCLDLAHTLNELLCKLKQLSAAPIKSLVTLLHKCLRTLESEPDIKTSVDRTLSISSAELCLRHICKGDKLHLE